MKYDCVLINGACLFRIDNRPFVHEEKGISCSIALSFSKITASMKWGFNCPYNYLNTCVVYMDTIIYSDNHSTLCC